MIKKILLALLALIVLFLGLLVFAPYTLINPTSVSLAFRIFKLDADLLRDINDSPWRITSPTAFEYRLSYSDPQLCIKTKVFDGCIKDIELELSLHLLSSPRDPLWTLHTLKATMENSKVRLLKTETSKKAEEKTSPFDPIESLNTLLRIFKRVQVEEIELKSIDLAVTKEESDKYFFERLQVSKKKDFERIRINLKARTAHPYSFQIEMSFPWVKTQKEFFDKLKLKAEILLSSQSLDLNYRARAGENPDSPYFAFSYKNHKKGIRSDGLLGIEWVQEPRLFLEDTTIKRKQEDFFTQKILLEQCQMTLQNADLARNVIESLRGSLLRGRCLLTSKIKKNQEMLWGNELLIDSLTVELQSEVQFTENYDMKGKLALKTRPFSKKLGDGEISANLDFSKNGDGELQLADAELAGNFKLHSFRKIAATLNQYFLAVPAPFHVLDGVIASTVEGSFHWQTMRLETIFKAQSKLESENQKLSASLKASIDGDFLHKRQVAIDADLVLLDAQIQLPELNLQKSALPLKDKRLVVAKDKKKKKSDLVFKTRFKLSTKKPLLVNNPKPKFVMPVVIDLRGGTNRELEGQIRLEAFGSRLFNRDILVKSLIAELPSQKISGLLTTKALEYDVSVDLSGKTDSIKLSFHSSPPLERRQIIALLLFNDPQIAEESEKAAAAGHFDVAAAQGALSLAAFYMFGNSKLQSFKYDPTTQSVSARLKLDNGASVELTAGDQGVEGVGYIRRIGTNWRIKTLGKGGGDESQPHSGQALIEWFKYFD